MENKLPKIWIETTLGAVTTKPQYGWTTKSQNFGEYKYLRTTDIGKGKINWNEVPFCIDLPRNIDDYILNKNDIVISRAGSIGFSYLVEEIESNILYASYLIRFKPLIYPKLIAYFLQSNSYWKAVSDSAIGIAVKNINAPKLQSIPFPLPPLREQERIVAKLDALFAQHEAMKKALERIPQLLKDFRQQVLTQAVLGKLTSNWREENETEDVDILFEEIITKRNKDYESLCKEAITNKQRKPSKKYLLKIPNIEKINIELPKNWQQTNIDFLAFVTKLAGFEYTEYFKVSEDGDIPIIRAQNVQMGRFEDKNRLYISKETSDYLVRSQLTGNEILMVFIGAGTGNVCLAPDNERWHLAPNVAKIDIDSINKKYLFYYLQSDLGIKNVLSKVKATAQPSLSMETIREIITVIPPLKEQQEIVSRVESLFAKADTIEKRYKTLKEKIDSLPQAILHKAFKGELVPQLPTDGDAKDLLEEILKLKKEMKKK